MPCWREISRDFFPGSASCNIVTIGVSVNRLRLMVVSLQGDPAGKLRLQHVSAKGKLTGRPFRAGDGKMKVEESDTTLARSSILSAASDNGTRCSAFIFIFLGGMVQTLLSKSISDHSALRASPGRAAVKIKKCKHSLDGKVASQNFPKL